MASFFGLKKYASDVPTVVGLGVGAVGAQIAWGYLSPYIPSQVKSIHPAVTPALELAAGVATFAWAAKSNLKAGSAMKKAMSGAWLGASAGLAAGGALGLLQTFGLLGGALPVAAAAGAQGGYLSGAPVTIEEVAGFAGAPVSIEEVAGLGSPIGATLY
jgi:hypothetical protein